MTEGLTMIFSKRLRSDDHVREFHVDPADHAAGRSARKRTISVVRRTLMDDWHRVENAMMKFALEATRLQRAGWIEVPIVSRM